MNYVLLVVLIISLLLNLTLAYACKEFYFEWKNEVMINNAVREILEKEEKETTNE